MISPGRCHLHRGDVTSSGYSTGFVVAKGLAQRDTDRSIKRLRSVQGDRADANESCDFWLELPNDFKEKGGTELAPFSSSADIKVALRYSDKAEKRILLKVATRSFMERGADMQYLSAFPDEAEYLYPPLTYMMPTGAVDEFTSEDGKVLFTVFEATPQI